MGSIPSILYWYPEHYRNVSWVQSQEQLLTILWWRPCTKNKVLLNQIVRMLPGARHWLQRQGKVVKGWLTAWPGWRTGMERITCEAFLSVVPNLPRHAGGRLYFTPQSSGMNSFSVNRLSNAYINPTSWKCRTFGCQGSWTSPWLAQSLSYMLLILYFSWT